MISLSDYFMGRDHTYAAELNNELVNNATVTVDRANALLKLFGTNRGVTSGWRPKTLNDATPGAAKKSNHIKCLAVDLEDKDGKLAKWCVENVERLVEIGLWMESPMHTKGWVHVQTIAPRSGNRIFIP